MKAEELTIDREITYVMEVERRDEEGAFVSYCDEEVEGGQVLVKVKELMARGMKLREQAQRQTIELTALEAGVDVTVSFVMTVLRPQIGWLAVVQCTECLANHTGEVVAVDNEAERFTIRPADEAHELHEDAWTQIITVAA
ncbi:hypothetical protein ACIRPQ_28935 [Streptomyces sp. NPDC101213]|uniref:hypothetical protein n=1 Tax=Streptomyces sp. NPDC101213 TaxID=3366130 RepID=UPI00380BD771